MRVDYLRYFEHLAKVLNYAKAAQDLYIAQPTLSVAIKRMEKELGIQLFKRAGEGVPSQRIELTETGAILQEYVAQALNSLDTGLRVAREKQGELNSSVRVGTIYAMQGRFWSQAIGSFQSSRSNPAKITFKQAYSPNLITRLRKGELDVIFAARTENSDDLNHLLVWSQPLVLVVNKENPLAKRKTVTIDDLKKYEILTYAKTSPVYPPFEELLPTNELSLHCDYDDEITLCAMVSSNKQNMGLCCYSFLVKAFEDVATVRIADLPIDFHKVYLISRRETHPKIVEEFIRFMSAYRFPNALEVGKF